MSETLILFAVLATNPLGFVSGTDELSQQTFLLLAAPFYRLADTYEPCWRRILCVRSDAAALITVVMIDEQTLTTAESGYPLDDVSLTTLVTEITNHCAAAVFVDLILGDPRPGERPLLEDLRRALLQDRPLGKDCDRKTPVYLADIPPDAKAGEAPAKDCEPCDRQAAEEEAGRSSDSDDGDSHLVHPSLRQGSLRLPVHWQQPAYAYPLRLSPPPGLPLGPEAKGGRWVTSEGDLPSPALQLYRDLRGDGAVKGLPEVMVVGWGWKQPLLGEWYKNLVTAQPSHHPLYCTLVHPDQASFPENFLARFAMTFFTAMEEALVRLVSSIGHHMCGIERGDPAQPYYYPLTISGAVFLLNVSGAEAEQHEADLTKAIAGRAVLIGQNATAASDRIVSPVHGVVPGVILHAQALDNLLLWGKQVWKSLDGGDLDPEDKPMSKERWLTFWVTVILSAAMSCLRSFCGFGRWSALGVACLAGIILTSWMVTLFCLAPINWIGVLVFLFWEAPLQLAREDEPDAAGEH